MPNFADSTLCHFSPNKSVPLLDARMKTGILECLGSAREWIPHEKPFPDPNEWKISQRP